MRAHQTLDLSYRQPQARGRLSLLESPLAHRFDHPQPISLPPTHRDHPLHHHAPSQTKRGHLYFGQRGHYDFGLTRRDMTLVPAVPAAVDWRWCDHSGQGHRGGPAAYGVAARPRCRGSQGGFARLTRWCWKTPATQGRRCQSVAGAAAGAVVCQRPSARGMDARRGQPSPNRGGEGQDRQGRGGGALPRGLVRANDVSVAVQDKMHEYTLHGPAKVASP